MTSFRLTDLHSPIYNYIVPGLVSWLLGERNKDGSCTRVFEMTRNQDILITPHSHRFGFECDVIRGEVEQTLWIDGADGDLYSPTELTYKNEPGQYAKCLLQPQLFRPVTAIYKTHQQYRMGPSDIHSIRFAKGSIVLLQEQCAVTDRSVILEPFVDGERLPTFQTQPWMFRKVGKPIPWAHNGTIATNNR